MTDRSDVIRIVRGLRSEWAPLLPQSDVSRADALLDQAHTADPDGVGQIENELLRVLAQTPQTQSLLGQHLTPKGLELLRTYSSPPGEGTGIDAGTLMVCPKDPSHCRKRLRARGQILYCAEHKVQLVPADSIEPKE